MGKERTKFDSIVDRAVRDALIEGLKRREQQINENLEFARRYVEQDFDEDAGEFDELENETFDEPDDDNAGALDNDDDDYERIERERNVISAFGSDSSASLRSGEDSERERRIAEDIAFILPFYGDDEGDDDWLYDETEEDAVFDNVRLFEEMEVQENG